MRARLSGEGNAVRAMLNQQIKKFGNFFFIFFFIIFLMNCWGLELKLQKLHVVLFVSLSWIQSVEINGMELKLCKWWHKGRMASEVTDVKVEPYNNY